MLNNLSADLDIMRPSMLETGLESLSYNINRRISNLQFFEFGKTYHAKSVANYYEVEHLSMYITGNNHEDGWRNKQVAHDFFSAKGYAEAILTLCGIADASFTQTNSEHALTLAIATKKQQLGTIVQVGKQKLAGFDIKQPVFFIDFDFDALLKAATRKKITYKEVAKFPVVQRDLALVIDQSITYATIEASIQKAKLDKLQSVRLFDVFENDKLGINKKSVAINFSFLDETKTLTDKETDNMMQTLVALFEKELAAVIRK
jgi:phenylalanyl-tRNA synthetase beta chain